MIITLGRLPVHGWPHDALLDRADEEADAAMMHLNRLANGKFNHQSVMRLVVVSSSL